MTTWHKETPLSDSDLAESDVDLDDHRDSFTIDRATIERLLTEAGYVPRDEATREHPPGSRRVPAVRRVDRAGVRAAGGGRVSRRRLPGTRWRFLAHRAPSGRGGVYGEPIRASSDDADPSVFDEVVVDSWLHVEQMDSGLWWMDVGGVTLHVRVDRDGRPTRVQVSGPGDWNTPVDGVEYVLRWTHESAPQPEG